MLGWTERKTNHQPTPRVFVVVNPYKRSFPRTFPPSFLHSSFSPSFLSFSLFSQTLPNLKTRTKTHQPHSIALTVFRSELTAAPPLKQQHRRWSSRSRGRCIFFLCSSSLLSSSCSFFCLNFIGFLLLICLNVTFWLMGTTLFLLTPSPTILLLWFGQILWHCGEICCFWTYQRSNFILWFWKFWLYVSKFWFF